jgi:hypothetical protein
MAAARAADVELSEVGGRLAVSARAEPDPQLLQAVRRHKQELLDILRGDRCRWCGNPIDWTLPGGLAFADGMAAHGGCGGSQQHGWPR